MTSKFDLQKSREKLARYSESNEGLCHDDPDWESIDKMYVLAAESLDEIERLEIHCENQRRELNILNELAVERKKLFDLLADVIGENKKLRKALAEAVAINEGALAQAEQARAELERFLLDPSVYSCESCDKTVHSQDAEEWEMVDDVSGELWFCPDCLEETPKDEPEHPGFTRVGDELACNLCQIRIKAPGGTCDCGNLCEFDSLDGEIRVGWVDLVYEPNPWTGPVAKLKRRPETFKLDEEGNRIP